MKEQPTSPCILMIIGRDATIYFVCAIAVAENHPKTTSMTPCSARFPPPPNNILVVTLLEDFIC